MKILEESSSTSSSSSDDPEANEDCSLQIVAKAEAAAAVKAEAKAAAAAKAKADADAAAAKAAEVAAGLAPKEKKKKKKKRKASLDESEVNQTKKMKLETDVAEVAAAPAPNGRKKKKRKTSLGDSEENQTMKMELETDPEMMPEPDLGLFVSDIDVDNLNVQKDVSLNLRTQWPWTVRAKNRCLDHASQPKALKLHGLHRVKNPNLTPMTKKDVDTVQKRVKAMGPLAKLCLEFYWPSLRGSYSTFDLLTHEYVKHGRPSGMNPTQYFKLTLSYFHKLTTNLKYKTNKEYTIGKFLKKLRKHATKNMKCNHIPSLYCVESSSLRCMWQEATDLTKLVFEGLSTCIRRTKKGLKIISSTKNDRWRDSMERMMIIPYKEVGQVE